MWLFINLMETLVFNALPYYCGVVGYNPTGLRLQGVVCMNWPIAEDFPFPFLYCVNADLVINKKNSVIQYRIVDSGK